MDKEDLIKDLSTLLAQRNSINGAIEYVSNKINQINQEEQEKLSDSKKLEEK